MTPEKIISRFDALRVWKGNGERAPHKPLLALWAIGRALRDETRDGKERLVRYEVVERELGALLREFGRPVTRVNPDLPFWHLRKDGVWEVPEANRIAETKYGHAKVKSLRREDAHGGLPHEIYQAFRENRKLALETAYSLVDSHFPDSLHDRILQAAGIKENFVLERRIARDPAFAGKVLQAYGFRCAICSFSVHLRGVPVALDAAHIKWHRAKGPNDVENGLALCSLHHRLFDAGAFTLTLESKVEVAKSARGQGAESSLRRFESKQINLPERTLLRPNPMYLRWHRREVFGIECS